MLAIVHVWQPGKAADALPSDAGPAAGAAAQPAPAHSQDKPPALQEGQSNGVGWGTRDQRKKRQLQQKKKRAKQQKKKRAKKQETTLLLLRLPLRPPRGLESSMVCLDGQDARAEDSAGADVVPDPPIPSESSGSTNTVYRNPSEGGMGGDGTGKCTTLPLSKLLDADETEATRLKLSTLEFPSLQLQL